MKRIFLLVTTLFLCLLAYMCQDLLIVRFLERNNIGIIFIDNDNMIIYIHTRNELLPYKTGLYAANFLSTFESATENTKN